MLKLRSGDSANWESRQTQTFDPTLFNWRHRKWWREKDWAEKTARVVSTDITSPVLVRLLLKTFSSYASWAWPVAWGTVWQGTVANSVGLHVVILQTNNNQFCDFDPYIYHCPVESAQTLMFHNRKYIEERWAKLCLFFLDSFDFSSSFSFFLSWWSTEVIFWLWTWSSITISYSINLQKIWTSNNFGTHQDGQRKFDIFEWERTFLGRNKNGLGNGKISWSVFSVVWTINNYFQPGKYTKETLLNVRCMYDVKWTLIDFFITCNQSID